MNVTDCVFILTRLHAMISCQTIFQLLSCVCFYARACVCVCVNLVRL